MKNQRVSVSVGYTKSGNLSADYHYFRREKLMGADISISDGIGNKIEIGAREHGTLITLNGKILKEIEEKKD